MSFASGRVWRRGFWEVVPRLNIGRHNIAGLFWVAVTGLRRYHSRVLGLDMQVVGSTLSFLSGEAELPISTGLIDRLQGMMLSVTERADLAEARADKAEARILQAETRIAQAETRITQAEADALQSRARGVLAVLRARGLTVSDKARERIVNEQRPERLDRWLEKAITASSVDEVLSDSDR